jgi:hypothetical protein
MAASSASDKAESRRGPARAYDNGVVDLADDAMQVCVPKTLSALMRWQNRLNWRNDWAAVFISCFRGRAIQVEEPA